MADLVVRGMEMPKNCAECPCFSQWDDCGITHEWKFADEFDKTKDRMQSCPLVPLPEGHGRLGDLDALFQVIGQDTDRWLIDDISYIETDDAISAVYMAPTIVPAEGGNADG